MASGVLAALIGCTAAPPAPTPTIAPDPSSSASTASASPSGSPSARTSPSATPSATATPKPLRISSVSNFRDVAGSGIELPGGGRMALGVVYRAGKLGTLSAADSRSLSKAGVSDVVDLRTDVVAARSPDRAINGAANHLVNVYAVFSTPALNLRSLASAQAHMRQLNIDFVAVPAQRRAIAKVLKLVAAAGGPVIVHCTEGKDRTGWISALLQFAAGAEVKQVVSDYLKSNQYRAGIIDAGYRAKLTSSGRSAAQVQRALLRVETDYLEAGLAEIESRYGDVAGYLEEGLGLSPKTVATLRQRLTA